MFVSAAVYNEDVTICGPPRRGARPYKLRKPIILPTRLSVFMNYLRDYYTDFTVLDLAGAFKYEIG